MRQFLASPFIALARLFGWFADKIDSEPFVCFSLREATEITEDNIDEILDDVYEEKK